MLNVAAAGGIYARYKYLIKLIRIKFYCLFINNWT